MVGRSTRVEQERLINLSGFDNEVPFSWVCRDRQSSTLDTDVKIGVTGSKGIPLDRKPGERAYVDARVGISYQGPPQNGTQTVSTTLERTREVLDDAVGYPFRLLGGLIWQQRNVIVGELHNTEVPTYGGRVELPQTAQNAGSYLGATIFLNHGVHVCCQSQSDNRPKSADSRK